MAILISSETTFIPSRITATGTQLNNLLTRAQMLGESAISRNLEIHEVIDTFNLGNYPPYQLHLREWPVNSITKVEITSTLEYSIAIPNWYEITDTFEYTDEGMFYLYQQARKLRVTYQSGFDFTPPASDRHVLNLKTAVGQLALALERLDKLEAQDDPRSTLREYLRPFQNYRRI